LLLAMRPATFRTNPNSQPRIVIRTFGKVDDSKVDRMVGIMRECYDRMVPHEVELVDLCVFERSSALEAFLAEESMKVGVVSSSFDASFFSMHDAWRGIPRIIVCFERMQRVPALAQEGGIRHEVGHSVLHGSLSYTLLRFHLC